MQVHFDMKDVIVTERFRFQFTLTGLTLHCEKFSLWKSLPNVCSFLLPKLM